MCRQKSGRLVTRDDTLITKLVIYCSAEVLINHEVPQSNYERGSAHYLACVYIDINKLQSTAGENNSKTIKYADNHIAIYYNE